MEFKTKKTIGVLISTMLGITNMAHIANAIPACATYLSTETHRDNVCEQQVGKTCTQGMFGTGNNYLYVEQYYIDHYSNGDVYWGCMGPNIVASQCCTYTGNPNCPNMADGTHDGCLAGS